MTPGGSPVFRRTTTQLMPYFVRTRRRSPSPGRAAPRRPSAACETGRTGIIPAMTERGLPLPDGASACPFVAFEDNRDERSDRPDHRHRCYAEAPPAPRAIAHQEAYCLTSAFAVCPTFQDWAQREAARTRRESQARAELTLVRDPDEENSGPSADGPPADVPTSERRSREDPASRVEPADEWRGSRRPIADDDDAQPPPPRRNPPRDWAAPPPWAGGAAAGASAAGGAGLAPSASRPVSDGDENPPRFLAEHHEGRGLAGSAADKLAAGEAVTPRQDGDPRGTRGEPRAPVSRDHAHPDPRAHGADAELASLVRSSRRDDDEDTDRVRAADRASRRPARSDDPPARRAAPIARGTNDAPAWEAPRRYEAYPTIKARPAMPGLPRIGILAAALALSALVLFTLPGILGWFGDQEGEPGGGAESSPTPAAVTPSPDPTPQPVPTPQVYVIRSGDTLSTIATRFGVSLDELLDANEDTIRNPDRIAVGDEIIIPVPDDGLGDPGGEGP